MTQTPPASEVVVSVRARTVAMLLALAIAALTVASLTGQILRFYFGHDYVFGLVSLFNVNREANVPTWYATATLLGASLLLWLIARVSRAAGERDARYWLWLSLLFLYVSADESMSLHEQLNVHLRPQTFLPGLLYFGWVVAGVAAVAVLGFLYARFLMRLAPPVRRLFFLAAALFVGGALGVEMLGARHVYHHGAENMEYALIATLEEVMEMAGVAVFIYALLGELGRRGLFCVRAG
ncbi:MAG TPA: hypothetical protein VK911_17960 [Vicinamibacterales bacterium]|nr:hypothetical protein [Vicinamibacterales bacterium]